MISAKNFHNWNQKIDANGGRVPFVDRILHPKLAYFRWKMNRAGLKMVDAAEYSSVQNLAQKASELSGANTGIQQSLESAQGKLAAADALLKTKEALQSLPAIFGSELGSAIAQKISFYVMIGEQIPATSFDRDKLSQMFWDAVKPINDVQRLKMHTIGGAQYGAYLNPEILDRAYLMNADIIPLLLKGVAKLVHDNSRGEVSVNAVVSGKNIVLDFSYSGSGIGNEKAAKINAACAAAGASFEASGNGSAQSARISLPFQ